ncbi:vitamin B12 dependent-methionine synthase activation domain-containing protein [Lachnospiraceae bacterium LCP25S3_G4]
MDNRTKEAIRYLGYQKYAVDSLTLSLIDNSFCELLSMTVPKSIYRIFQLVWVTEHAFKIGKIEFESKQLSKNLKGCSQVILYAATLGTGVDQLLRKYAIGEMAKVIVLQACATAMLEEYCDETQDIIGKNLQKEKKYLRPRFSPGYGDFDIMHQRAMLDILDAAKKIGISMTDSYMLSPTKSITAIIGVSDHKISCHRKGCELCTKEDCLYRRSERC